MNEDDLKRRLEELHERLGDVDEDDETGAATDELRDHVRRFDRTGGTEREHAALVDRLRRAALRFEASHPELSSEIASIVDSLTAAGI